MGSVACIVISRKMLRDFSRFHPDARSPLDKWYRVAKHAEWRDFAGVRKTFSSADVFEDKVIFNLGGNKYRLVAVIHYNRQRLYIRHVLTHEMYSREGWKND